MTTAHQRGYTSRWRAARAEFLARNPFCAICAEHRLKTKATVVDHIIPHRGNQQLFWDRSNWQALCTHCHNSYKTPRESGYKAKWTPPPLEQPSAPRKKRIRGCDLNGIPIDPAHPWHG